MEIDRARYSRTVAWSAADQEFVALCPEFTGLSGLGETQAAALAALDDAIAMAIEIAREDGEPLPAPRQLTDYSGEFRVRLPRTLHCLLTNRAHEDGTSLNTVIVALLSERLGELAGHTRARAEMRSELQKFAGSLARTAAQQITAILAAPVGAGTVRAEVGDARAARVLYAASDTSTSRTAYAVGN